jgi:hypothetical protein
VPSRAPYWRSSGGRPVRSGRLVVEAAEEAPELALDVGRFEQAAAVVLDVVRRSEPADGHRPPADGGEPCVHRGVVGADAGAAGQRDLGRRHVVRVRLGAVARRTLHEHRQLLRTADLARVLVAEREAPVARDALRADGAALEPLAGHRFHRVAPHLDDRADARHAGSSGVR